MVLVSPPVAGISLQAAWHALRGHLLTQGVLGARLQPHLTWLHLLLYAPQAPHELPPGTPLSRDR